MLARIVLALAVTAHPLSACAAALNPDFSDFPKLHAILTDRDFTPPVEPFAGDLHTLASEIHNRYKHGFRYVPSQQQYGAGNYWPTRGQTLKSRAADCKGFAVAAYYDLLEAGVPEDTMFIWVAVIRKTGELHAVTIVGDYVIDRIFNRVVTLEEGRRIYANIYRFNRNGWTQDAP